MLQRANPFQPIYDACNQGTSQFKLEHLPDFPRYVDIELTNTCNFKCLMCPTGIGSSKRKRGMMSDDVFEKILSELAPHRTAIRFIRWGEPLLHNNIVNYIKLIKNAGAAVHINTNGSLLDDSLITQLIDAGLDSIKFSFQGVDRKSYLEMRNIDFFDGLLSTIRRFHELRGNRLAPYMHISTSITYETIAQVNLFKELTKDIADQVSIGRTILDYLDPAQATRISIEDRKRLEELKKQETVVKKHPQCPEVFDKLSINWDGTISACCNDYDNTMVLGDIKTQSLQSLWTSLRMTHYRRLLSQMRHDDIPLCRTCYDYLGLQTPGLQDTY